MYVHKIMYIMCKSVYIVVGGIVRIIHILSLNEDILQIVFNEVYIHQRHKRLIVHITFKKCMYTMNIFDAHYNINLCVT